MTAAEKLAASLTDDVLAQNAHLTARGWSVPQVVWVKEHQGQVTDGRIGRPVVRWCPIGWLPIEREKRVRRLIARQRSDMRRMT